MAGSNHAALKRFLERILRRSALSAAEQSAILNVRSHASQAPAHCDIVSPGTEVDHACLVVDGLVGRFDQLADGHRQITAMYIPGDLCDLHSVVLPVPAWGLEALATTTVLHIPHDDLRGVAAAHPAIATAFWREAAADASIMAKWVANIGRKDARARLAYLLCEMGFRMELAGLGSRTEYAFPVTQTQLGDALGLTPVHVNRTVQRLRRERVLGTNKRNIHITDWNRLAALAEFDPHFLLVKPAVAQLIRYVR